jgi:hypothetical protein
MYESPLVTDLGSVSEMTRAMGGAYGEFVQPGSVNRRRRRRRRGRGKGGDGGGGED